MEPTRLHPDYSRFRNQYAKHVETVTADFRSLTSAVAHVDLGRLLPSILYKLTALHISYADGGRDNLPGNIVTHLNEYIATPVTTLTIDCKYIFRNAQWTNIQQLLTRAVQNSPNLRTLQLLMCFFGNLECITKVDMLLQELFKGMRALKEVEFTKKIPGQLLEGTHKLVEDKESESRGKEFKVVSWAPTYNWESEEEV